ncbi:hypothetical protein CF336_g7055 [Tilletia laevis]|uniref:Uncharacterized protein n=1 Tax=Tilletia caries TaxID=13290 RepID=A0A177V1G7_9BASI|nr:hypothetical protein CF336_g7055 [Tilletia laevis]KAE8190051.1 hypothetical protein CF335_g6461 [Tilletia laevis]KAE8250997.1 hypothetical protein A4X03_0g6422 [Tilletia caries]
MQILRSSDLLSFLPVVLIYSMAVAMVAAAPAPTSAISNFLEHRTAVKFLKRALPDLTVLGRDALEKLYDARERLHELILESISKLEDAGGNTRALEGLRVEEAEAATEMDRIVAELERTELRL